MLTVHKRLTHRAIHGAHNIIVNIIVNKLHLQCSSVDMRRHIFLVKIFTHNVTIVSRGTLLTAMLKLTYSQEFGGC